MLEPFPFDGPSVRAVVTTRAGGTSEGVYGSLNLGNHVGDDPAAVRRNRDLVAAALGVPALTVADQQHGATVAVVTAADAGLGHDGRAASAARFPATDALVTDVAGLALAILVADCAPVVLWDPVRHAAGAAHAGRPGVVRGVVGATVARMTAEFGSDPADLVAGIGPCVGYDSYEVRDIDAESLDAVLPGFTRASRPGHRFLDVGGAVERQLAGAGVGTVHRMRVDTRTSTDTFFSDRAERPCGRFMAVVALR